MNRRRPKTAGRYLARLVPLVSLALLVGVTCRDDDPPLPLFPSGQCAPEPLEAPPRPLWSQQPDRVIPFAAIDNGSSSLGNIVSCDLAKLGKYPVPEGGNPHPKGADLQNISTNFHVLQSLTMAASLGSKALATLQELETGIDDPTGLVGPCVCNIQTPPDCVTADPITLEACQDSCEDCDGKLVWLPNDVYFTPMGLPKFAIKQLHLLDELQDFVNSPVYQSMVDVLGPAGAIANLTDILARMQCWTDLFLEGYHIGGYDEQRPDLHLCIGYYGHGAYAGISENGKFDIGGRYSSHNISAKHRAQMRLGGWGVTAFGKTLTLVPNVELNLQLDGYRFFNKCKPLGFSIGGDPMFDCDGGFGVWIGDGLAPLGTIDIDAIDMFHLVDRSQMQSLDSDGNGVLSAGEFVVAGYYPFNYPDNADGPYQWPRTAIDAGWEGRVASVMSAGLNIDPHITPKEKIVGTYVIAPGVTFVPILTLKAGVEWDHEAYKLRSRLLDAINKNLAEGLKMSVSGFERDTHAMQAPDISADTGVSAFVTPGVKAQLVVGVTLSKFLQLGVSAFIGLELDIRPDAHGGLVDLHRDLTTALNASNPPDGPCSPVIETGTRKVCSDKSYDKATPNHSDPDKTYACKPSQASNSCCLQLKTGLGASSVCIDGWTGITESLCSCNGDPLACYLKFKGFLPAVANATIEGWLQSGSLSTVIPTWNEGKTCKQCNEDGSCKTALWARTPEFTALSECARHGYCVLDAVTTLYDMTELDCNNAGGTFNRYQCVHEVEPVVTGWEGPGCHPLTGGFPSACGCASDADCAPGETCDGTTAKCGSQPADCACNPPGNTDPVVECTNGRICVDGACARPCGDACPEGLVCGDAGACVPQSGAIYAEQIAWRSTHPSPGPQHSIESYGLTDFTLTLILSSGVHVGAVVKLFRREFDFTIWEWSDAWDLGSVQKSKYQPGLEATYLDECHGTVGEVINHQPGSGDHMTCSIGESYVCRYPSSSAPDFGLYDQPDELLAHCKKEMPLDTEDLFGMAPSDFGESLGNVVQFGIDVGTTVWNNRAPMCVGDQLLTEWAQSPAPMQGQCKYLGDTPGAPATFPCMDIEKFSLEIWGCLNTASPQGAQVMSFLQANGLAAGYVVSPTYSSSLTSAQVIDLHALVVDPSESAASAQFHGPVAAAADTAAEQAMLRGFLHAVEQCYETHLEQESTCSCDTAADCAPGAICDNNQCLQSSGTLAVCPFISFDADIDPHPCCGDHVVESAANEQCDDGNLVDGDGCSSDCKPEKGAGACCTPSGCFNFNDNSAGDCGAKQGTPFYGKTCAELKDCGHTTQGGCVDSDGFCHGPATIAACDTQVNGTFVGGGCGPLDTPQDSPEGYTGAADAFEPNDEPLSAFNVGPLPANVAPAWIGWNKNLLDYDIDWFVFPVTDADVGKRVLVKRSPFPGYPEVDINITVYADFTYYGPFTSIGQANVNASEQLLSDPLPSSTLVFVRVTTPPGGSDGLYSLHIELLEEP